MKTSVPMRQAKNGGSLLKGGKPGHRGGGGRPPEVLRRQCRNTLVLVLEEVERRLENPAEMPLLELLKLIDVLGKYGIGQSQPKVDPNDLSDEQIIRILNNDTP